MDDISDATSDFMAAARSAGVCVALVMIDQDQVMVTLRTDNASQATVAVGLLLASILREPPPDCPHCLNNYRRCEAALQVMRDHPLLGDAKHWHGGLN